VFPSIEPDISEGKPRYRFIGVCDARQHTTDVVAVDMRDDEQFEGPSILRQSPQSFR
jgi:hypothetical protein